MSNVLKLKKRAGEFEQKKQLDRALELYVQLLDEAGRDLADDDVPLYNRVGDLLMRQGNVTEALSYYERAVDVYAERGFLNNAIALCNKILRQSPGRTAVYYKLGKISASKGFKSDARKNFLEYADRVQKGGHQDEALRALKEFASLYPDQDDVRLILAEQLSKGNRKGEALEQLQALYEKLESEGRRAEARATIDRMKAIDPNVLLRQSGSHAAQRHNDLIFLDLSSEEPRSMRHSPVSTPRAPSSRAPVPAGNVPALEGLSVTFLPDETEPAEAAPVSRVDGFEPTRVAADTPSEPNDASPASSDAFDVIADSSPMGFAGTAEEISAFADGLELEVEPPVPLEELESEAPIDVADAPDVLGPLVEQPPLSGSEFATLELEEVPRVADSRPHDLALPTALPLLEVADVVGDEVVDVPADEAMPVDAWIEAARVVAVKAESVTDDTADDAAITHADPADAGPHRERPATPVPIEALAPETRARDDAPALAGGVADDIDAIREEAAYVSESAAVLPTAPVESTPIPLELPPSAHDQLGDMFQATVDRVTGGHNAVVPDISELAPAADDDFLSASPSFGTESATDQHAFPPLPGLADEEPAADRLSRKERSRRDRAERRRRRRDRAAPASGEASITPPSGAIGVDVSGSVPLPGEDDAPVDAPLPEGFDGETPAGAITAAEPGKPASNQAQPPMMPTPRSTLSLGGAEAHLRRRLEFAPEDWALRRQLGEALLESGDRDGGLCELELAMVGYELGGDLDRAQDVADEIIRMMPTSVRHHQKRVEFAVRMRDRHRLSFAYLELADALFRTGAGDKSIAVYSRVIDLDPENERALFALATFAPDHLAQLRGQQVRTARWTDEMQAIDDRGPFVRRSGESAAIAEPAAGAGHEEDSSRPDAESSFEPAADDVNAAASETPVEIVLDERDDAPGARDPASAADAFDAPGTRDFGFAAPGIDVPIPDAEAVASAPDETSLEPEGSASAPEVTASASAAAAPEFDASANVSDLAAAPSASDGDMGSGQAMASPAAHDEDAIETAAPAGAPDESHDEAPQPPAADERASLADDVEPATAAADDSSTERRDGTPSSVRASGSLASVNGSRAARPVASEPPPVRPARLSLDRVRAVTPPLGSDSEYVDLGEWLRMTEPDKSTRMVVEDPKPTGDEAADFAEMLRRFKRGVAENMDAEDFEAHYDLGVAFKEMGLVDEAIAEFQKALRGATQRVRSYEALGQCFVEKGQYPIAGALLQRAVETPGTDDQQLVGVLYLLAFALEHMGRPGEALRYYQRVFAVDIEFRDVAERVSTMEQLTK